MEETKTNDDVIVIFTNQDLCRIGDALIGLTSMIGEIANGKSVDAEDAKSFGKEWVCRIDNILKSKGLDTMQLSSEDLEAQFQNKK